MYSCTQCQLSFTSNKSLTQHFKTKKHMDGHKENKYKCVCGKSYSFNQGLFTHRKKCDQNNLIQDNNPFHVETLINQNNEMKEVMSKKDEEIREIIDKKDHQIDELRKAVEMLLKQSGKSTTNNHMQTQNNIETQNVIVVNSFGNENTEYLTDQIISRLIQAGPFTCLPKIIERIHFDPEHPENHNIKVTNQKNNYAKVVKDNKWITANKKHAIDTMIQKGYGLLEENYQDNKETVSEFKQERFEVFQEKYADQDKDLMKTIKDDVDIALLNGTGKIYKQ